MLDYAEGSRLTAQTIFTHPLVQFCFWRDSDRWAFAGYFIALQEQSPEPLSMRETIERYRCSSFASLAEVMDA